MVAKTTGIGASIVKNRSKLGKVTAVMLSGRFARCQPRAFPDEVDLLIVGDINMSELSALVKLEEARRQQPINYTPMTDEELKFRRTRRDPFLFSILTNSRVMIIGDEQYLTG
jgi:hypothetical protein